MSVYADMSCSCTPGPTPVKGSSLTTLILSKRFQAFNIISEISMFKKCENCSFSNSGHVSMHIPQSFKMIIISMDSGFDKLSNALQHILILWRTMHPSFF